MNNHSGIYSTHSSIRMIAGIFIFTTVLFLSLPAQSQSYFYIENQIPGSETDLTLYSFLIVSPDGSAIVKTRPVSQNLTTQPLADSIFPNVDTSGDFKYLVPSGKMERNTSDTSFIYNLRFVFKKQVDNNNIYYIPYRTEYENRDGKWQEANTVAIQEKTFQELSDLKDTSFVQLFYKTNDEFYRYLFEPITRGLHEVKTGKIFLILVANTFDKNIGSSSKKDFENINSTFTTLAANLGMKLTATRISGIYFNKNNVDRALLNLKKAKPSKNDIIIFYYSGHGFRYSNDTSAYPRMVLMDSPNLKQLAKNNLSVEYVYKLILGLGARVSIVLADCCNDDIGKIGPPGGSILNTRSDGLNTTSQSLNMNNCNALFFSKSPVRIIASSTQINQLAIGNPSIGGFFTYFFNGLLKNSLYTPGKNDSWIGIMTGAKEKARWQATSAMCGSTRCVQLTEMDLNPRKYGKL